MRTASLAVLALTGTAATALGQATFTQVPNGFNCRDITPDGEIVVGNSNSGGGYYWRWKVDAQPTLIGGTNVAAVNDDGSVIVGNMNDPGTGSQIAGRWTQATGWVPLPPLSGTCGSISSGYDVSGDGDVVVGLGWNGCSGRGFRWTESTGTLELQNLGNGNNRASAVSRNGLRAVGFAQGSFNRTPAWWDADTTGSVFDLDETGELYGINDVGTIVVGERNGQAFWELLGTNSPNYLGSLNPGWAGNATDLSEDLERIIGFDSLGLGREAWIWTPANGIERLQDKLTALGVQNVPALGVCDAITPNGRTIVGSTPFGGGWIVEIPVEPEVTVYGCLNPVGSLTVLGGSPEPGQTLTLGVDNPLGTQPVGSIPLLFVANAPALGFPCGLPLPGSGMGGGDGEVLISIAPPNPLLFLLGPVWTGAGNPAPFALMFPNKPSLIGQRIYVQGAMVDITGTTIPVATADAALVVIGG